ncbi:hypothetical protein [Streptomyces altiplanensis]
MAIAVAMLLACCGVGCENQPVQDSVTNSEIRNLTVAEEIAIERAEQIHIKACMAEQDLPYWEFPVPSADERKEGRYVIEEVEWARKYGYGRVFQERGERIRRTHPTTTYQNELSQNDRAAYTRALDGDTDDREEVKLPGGRGTVSTPRGGCVNKAREELYGDARSWFVARKTVENLIPLYGLRLLEDKRFTISLRKWAQCMRNAGRPFDSPQQLRQTREVATQGMPQSQAHAFDKKLAVVEATCAQKTALGEVLRSLEASYREKTLKKYSDQLDDYREMRVRALKQARQVTP